MPYLKLRFAAGLLSVLLISPAFAQQAVEPAAAEAGIDVSGDLVSISRQTLSLFAQRGVSFHAQFVHDWSKNLSRGYDAAYGLGRYSFDLSATIDTGKSLGWDNGTGFIRLKQHQHEFGWSRAQAAQVYSNIDGASRTTLYEMWVEQKWMAGKLRVKGGKIDANTEFAVVENAGDFLNSSMGFSPTILAFPTYPEPKPGALVSVSTLHGYGISLGNFQTTMGSMSIAEPRRHWRLGANELAGHFSAGYWRFDGEMTCFDGGRSSLSQGFYSVMEQSLWRSQSGNRDQAVSAFLQFGRAGGDVSPFTQHLGAGVVWQAPLASRPNDALGMAATWAKFSARPAAGFDYSSELISEGYYKLSLHPHLALVSDLQFLHHPAGLRANPDVVVFTPRLVVSF